MTSFSYARSYRGGVRAVILDWAGTTVDFGSMAPVAAFTEVFRQRGVALTAEQVRAPMGLHKKDHIRAIAQMEAVAAAFRKVHGRACDESDVSAIYEAFVPVQLTCIRENARLIPGTLEMMEAFRARGIKVGSTTGYTKEMIDVLLPVAREQGYRPDVVVSASEVPAGRPAPWMCFRAAMELGVYPLESAVKIGDTVADIEEGLNAGMWTIGLTACGNEVGLGEAELAALEPRARAERIERAAARLGQAGAHYVASGPHACITVVEEIDRRIRAGERP